MSTISASTTTTTAYKVTADTTGTLVLQTGATPTTAVTIDSSQNVGIGTSSPSYKLDVNTVGGSQATARLIGNDQSNVRLRLENSGSGGRTWEIVGGLPGANNANFSIRDVTGGTTPLNIDSSGNLLVGTTSQFNSGKFCEAYDGQVYNGIVLKDTNATLNGNYLAFYNSAGTNAGTIARTGTTTVSYNTSSDYRLKENIQPMHGALDVVAQLNPVTYTWKADGSDGQGFIAHELQAVVPDCVTGEKDAVDADGNPKYQGIDTSFLVATLTAAIQELKAELDAAKADIATLKGAA